MTHPVVQNSIGKQHYLIYDLIKNFPDGLTVLVVSRLTEYKMFILKTNCSQTCSVLCFSVRSASLVTSRFKTPRGSRTKRSHPFQAWTSITNRS